MIPANFNWKQPDYLPVFLERERRLRWLRENPSELPALKLYYKDHLADFINDWGVTVDPRNIEIGVPAVVPFLLFNKQREWIAWTLERWRKRERGLAEKSRDMGISWLAMALADSLCIFYDGMTVGVGSRKQEYVDKVGHPKALLYKARMFMQHLPVEFRGGWDLIKTNAEMRVSFPETGAVITGECGDSIGRGDRASIYFVDESAHLEHPELTEASLSNTTNCRIDMSSVNGTANPFAVTRNSGKVSVFTFHWRDDPRKDDAWYADMCAKYDAVTIAQEVDINYAASVEHQVIEPQWIQAAINLHERLQIKPTGYKHSAFDVADQGKDKNAWAARDGLILQHVTAWSGAGKDIFKSVQKVFALCDERGYRQFDYDADGVGAGVAGDARVINEARKKENTGPRIIVAPFHGSGKVHLPEAKVKGPDSKPLDRTNENMFANYKAQAWWNLRFMFQQSFRAINDMPFDRDNVICIDKNIKELPALIVELAQPTYDRNTAGKILIDKQPEGIASPNLADAVMMAYAPRKAPMTITDETLRITGGQ